jgi:uncharacterized protein
MLGMWLFNMVLAGYLALMLLKPLFGISDYETFMLGTPKTPNEVNAFLFVQGLSSIFGFLLTAIMFAKLEWGSARKRLLINLSAPLKMFLMALLAIIIAQFFIDFLVELNSKIPLPAALSSLRDAEKQTEEMLNALLGFHSAFEFLIVSVVLALIPAVAEEFFFRGLLLGGLLRAKINAPLSITITALIFAISHWEFNNTLAIFLLGLFLGYLYYISGSIWVSVAAHFTNNFMQVLFKYLYNIGVIGKDIADATMPVYVVIISALLFAGCVYILGQWKQPVIYEDDNAPEPPQQDWMGHMR